MIDENKKKIVIDNYFKSECNANILESYVKTMKETYAKGFERGLSKASKTRIGKWISQPYQADRECSVCGHTEPYKFADKEAEIYHYCPHCGARMENE